MDNDLTYYEIPTQLTCAYLKGHLTGRALDWFEVLGYRVVEDKATDYEPLKQALSEQFPVIHKILKLEMTEEKLIDHIINRLEPQILDDYVEKDQRFSSWKSRDIKPNENNRFPNRNRQENWRETRGNNRYTDNSRSRREFNRFGQGVADNQRFDGRRRGGQSDHRFHNEGGRLGGSRNSAFRDQPGLTHVLYHEIDTGDKGPYRYDSVKQGIIDYHIEKMLQEEQFNLFTDASRVGIGAVLNQNHIPIRTTFVSRTLNKAERNYTVTERKCLAVIWALNKFKTYFGSLPVKESSRQYGWITNFVCSSLSPSFKLQRTTHSRAKGRS
ncbi:uncharacterized protein TNCV_297431 [Trichonephila clavipes]|nr:uncharacterized protein TNCV_297431 [Trichonephila clavipes]